MSKSHGPLDKYLRDLGQVPLLTPDEEIELGRKIRNGDAAARERMIHANLRLVVTIARDYVNLGLPLPDLISEGNIGLMEAVRRFDPGKGSKLSTYATWWINRAIQRALVNQSKTIRLPAEVVDRIRADKFYLTILGSLTRQCVMNWKHLGTYLSHQRHQSATTGDLQLAEDGMKMFFHRFETQAAFV